MEETGSTRETTPAGHHEPRASNARRAFGILRFAFVVAPILAGLDKFLNLLTDWDRYVAPVIDRILPLSPTGIMYVVGPVEIAAGLLVAFRPRIGGYVVAAWLTAIILNLLMVPGYFDIALRDLGLALAALALAELAGEAEAGAVGV